MAFIPLLLLASAYLVFGKDFSHPKLRQFSKETRITDTYILVFDPSISDVESKVDALKSSLPGIEVEHIYYHALKGVSFAIPETTVYALSETLSDEEVLYAEEVCPHPPCTNKTSHGLVACRIIPSTAISPLLFSTMLHGILIALTSGRHL